MDNEIDRKINVTAILFLLVQNRHQHMTEPWLDQALIESANKCAIKVPQILPIRAYQKRGLRKS